MRRYAAVQKARDADVFGILVGTLGVGEPSFVLNRDFSSRLDHIQRHISH